MTTSTTTQSIQEIWDSMVQDLKEDNSIGMKRRLVLPESKFKAYLMMDGVHFNKLFVLALPAESTATIKAQEMRGLRLHEGGPVSDETGRSVIMRLKDERFESLFNQLVVDVLDHIQDAGSADEALGVLASRVDTWRSMTAGSGSVMLSPSEQTGLFGELWFIRSVMFVDDVAEDPGIDAWRGPTGAAHDFQWKGGAVEVKTTLAENPQSIRISNETQLDDGGIPALFLYHISLAEHLSGEHTLPALIDDIRTLLPEPDLQLFNSRLSAVGYSDALMLEYAERHYIYRTSTLYEVRNGFPRITSADLADGISDVSYAIQLSNCQPFKVEIEELKPRLQEEA